VGTRRGWVNAHSSRQINRSGTRNFVMFDRNDGHSKTRIKNHVQTSPDPRGWKGCWHSRGKRIGKWMAQFIKRKGPCRDGPNS